MSNNEFKEKMNKIYHLFNEPDLDHLRKVLPELKAKNKIFEDKMKRLQKVSSKTLHTRFTI